MKVAINGSMLDDKPTGVGVYTYNIINTLNRLSLKPSLVDKQITVYAPTQTNIERGVNVVKISRFVQASRYGKFAALGRFVWNVLPFSFIGGGYDILVNPTTHGSLFRRNQVITIHDLLSLRFSNISGHQRWYFRTILPHMIKRCKLVVAVSEATKRDIVDYLGCDPEKIKVIYNGYDSSVFNLANADGGEIARHYRVTNYILAVGPTYPHKNFEVLLRAYSSLSDSVKENFPLVIAGGMRKYVDRLKEVISEYNLGRHVKFLGYVPSILMPQLYGSARVLVFPSLYEGFGFPILEAMACGCPVIASNVSSIPEVCGDSALLFDPTNETELVGLILKLIGSEELREELVSKGLQQATRFSWDEAGKKWIELLESIK